MELVEGCEFLNRDILPVNIVYQFFFRTAISSSEFSFDGCFYHQLEISKVLDSEKAKKVLVS